MNPGGSNAERGMSIKGEKIRGQKRGERKRRALWRGDILWVRKTEGQGIV